jgi:hypothetical protein
MQFPSALRTASLLSAALPNIRQKPLATDATGSFPGSHMRHCIFSSKILEFENTINPGGDQRRGGTGKKVFSEYWWYDLAQHWWYDFAKRYRNNLNNLEKFRKATLKQRLLTKIHSKYITKIKVDEFYGQ